MTLPTNLSMSGSLDLVLNTLEGLNFDAEADEDLLDPTEIDLDEPTRTKTKENPTADVLEVQSPGSIGLGF